MLQIDIEVKCDTCGGKLDIAKDEIKHDTIKIVIEPCKNCMDDEYMRGRQEEAE